MRRHARHRRSQSGIARRQRTDGAWRAFPFAGQPSGVQNQGLPAGERHTRGQRRGGSGRARRRSELRMLRAGLANV